MTDVVKIDYLKTADLVERTGVAESTVRKYCAFLEKQGYQFKKDGDMRLFTSEDVEVIKSVAKLRESSSLSVQHAVGAVLATLQTSAAEDSVTLPSVSEEFERYTLQMKNVVEQLVIDRQEEKLENQRLRAQIEEMTVKLRAVDEKMDEVLLVARSEKHGTKKKRFFGLF